MAYIGSTPTSQNFTSGTDYFSGTGSQTDYTLTRTVNSVNDIEVVINNVVQQPSTAYTLSGTTITFTSAPSSGTNNIYVRYLATNMQSFTVPANSITRTQLDSNLQAGFQGRNKIINGSMVINQRGFSGSITDTGAVTYTLDRWNAYGSVTSKFSVAQSSTAPAGFINSLLITSSSAYTVGSGEFFILNQAIEGLNTADLGWGTTNAKTVTLSFQVYSSLTGTFGGSITNSGNSRSYPFTYTVSSANTWTTVSIPISGDTSGTWLTTNGIGLYLRIGIGVGSTYSGTAGSWSGNAYYSATGATSVVGTSGATFYITGVQLEEGTTATSFEREAYSVTLQKCQRYYTKINLNTYTGFVGWCDSTTEFIAMASFPVTLRTEPTFTSTGAGAVLVIRKGGAPATVNTTTLYQTSSGTQVCRLYAAVSSGLTTGAGGAIAVQDGQTAYMAWSAEL